MHSLLRSVARLLLTIMLATVFSPSFAWQAVEGMAAHDHPAPALAGHDDHHAHDDHHGDVDHHHAHQAAALPGDAAEACAAGGDASAEAAHQCCPGHVLGHLLGGTGSSLYAIAVASPSAAPMGSAARFSSRIPEGLERPPRSSAA